MGELVNASLMMLGTGVAICGITFYIREKESGSLRNYILLMGIFASLWCYGYGMMGMYTTAEEITLSRAVGLFAIVGYLGALLCMVMHMINVPALYRKIVASFYFIYGMSDFVLMAWYSNYRFVHLDGRTAYYIVDGFVTSYHKIFLAIAIVGMYGMGVIWVLNRNIKQDKKLVLVIELTHLCLVFSVIPDTVLPAFGMPSFPATCYGVAFAYCILWYNCVHNNVFSITIQNISSYVYRSVNTNILVFNMEKKLYMANASAHTFFGLEGRNGQDLSDLFDIDKEDAEKYFDDVVSGDMRELNLTTKNTGKSCGLRFTVAKDKKERPYCVLIFVYDLTKEEQMLEELRNANRAKSDFLSNMSHEIRTPINAIIGMNEMILRESEDEQIMEYASTVHNSSTTLLSLVNEILDISKIESGKIEIVKANYELASLLLDCYNMITEKATQKNLEVELHCDETLPYLYHGDVVRIRQIVLNLLTNAVKYTEKGKVVLSVTGEMDEDGMLLKFEVSDTGIGISQENIAKLFERFERFDLKKNRNIEGTGLGLYITKTITELMGGDIHVQSEYGKGSVFTVTIPQKCVDNEPIGRLNLAATLTDKDKFKHQATFVAPDAKILVVDDIDVNLKVFLNLVKHLKLQVDTALSGQKCLELVCQNKYDIIFMDHMMPEMDGIVTLEHMKKEAGNKNGDTPVIMLTANALSGMKEMYLAKGFTDYLSKPIDGIKLEEKIERYLPSQKVLRKSASQEKINDKVNADMKSDIKETPLEHLKNAVKDIDIDKALQYCAGSEGFYLECLKDYCNNGRKAIIEQAYAAEDWNRYGIEVHALKSTSRTLGFEALGDMAESMQAAAEAQDAPYIRENHEKLLEKFEHILKVIAECV